MKHLILSTLLSLILLSTSLSAQTQTIPYLGTAISSQGQLLTSQSITVRLSIFDDIASGSAAYVETQTATTTATGAFSVQVGSGTVVTGTYTSINLMSSTHYLQIEIKPSGGTYSTISKGPIAQSTVVCPPNPPTTPTAASHVPSTTQIVWNWNSQADATAFKWNTVNDYASATDMGAALTKTETGLTCNTAYTRYVWDYTICGHSAALTLNQTTSSCPFTCGNTITVNHVAGSVAPVSKTVTYGTVSNIPGETSKCWITSNLGADHQATALGDATEESAGWYWQFNRIQGYKHDGTTRTPNTTWISDINESSNWLTANDPCTSELGTSWRLPTNTEWSNVKAAGSWTTYYQPWGSDLVLHLAGFLYPTSGALQARGTGSGYGFYWGSVQGSAISGSNIFFYSSGCNNDNAGKSSGIPIRCIHN